MLKKKREVTKHRPTRLDDDYGQPSLGRWLVYYGTILSMAVTVIGLIISIYEVAFQIERQTNIGVSLVVCGVGIYTSGAIAKSWQSQAEAKKMRVFTPSEAEHIYAEDITGGLNASTSTDPVND